MLRKLALLLGAGLIVVAAALVLWIGPSNVIGLIQYGGQAREGTLAVGDAAPTPTLVSIDGTPNRSLSDWIGPRPLVLVFGSFT